jgi:hypothetical protein
MADYYLSRAFATASDNDCHSVSLFYYGIAISTFSPSLSPPFSSSRWG